MKFTPETEVDFLKNEYFVDWVRSPTKESTEYWNRWLNQNPDKAPLLRSACDLLLSFQVKETHFMEDASYYKILDTLLEENNKSKTNSLEKTTNSNSWLVAAASIMFLSTLSVIAYFLNKDKPNQQLAAVVNYTTESVPKGFKKTVILPDGSEVKLNSESELKYPVQFSDTLREVYLDGQAFFEIKKNKAAPFIVHTTNLSTRVLGTSFDVRSYNNEKIKHVAVLTGNVEVTTAGGPSEMLLPLDITMYNQEKKALTKSTFKPGDVLAWRNGVIVFNHASFNEVAQYLSRWYGVEFSIEQGLVVKGYYTGRFDKEALTTVLRGISYSSHFKFSIKDKQVFITKPN